MTAPIEMTLMHSTILGPLKKNIYILFFFISLMSQAPVKKIISLMSQAPVFQLKKHLY